MKKGTEQPLLELLTGSPVRARLLRLLLREPQLIVRMQDAAERIQEALPAVRREAAALEALGLLHVRGGSRLAVSQAFPFFSELRGLAVRSFPISRQELVKILSRCGGLQLAVLSGVFLNTQEERVDVFVVASRYSEKRLASAIKKLEAMVGTELRWAGMETKEFNYRWKMFDRFLRDVFTQPHEKLVERIKL